MAGRTQYNHRSHAILHSIVAAYIETGEPVASRSVARAGGDQLSPATIRNVMADLVDDGFLAQPHTSAGRVPTLKAFRSYVESLPARRLAAAELQRMRSELLRTDSVEERLEKTSHLLTEMTHNVGIAAAIPSGHQKLAKVELLLLADRRVLLIIETSDHIVRNRVVTPDQSISQDELNNIRNFLNRHFTGWTLANIRRELHARLAQERSAYDELLRKLQLLYQKGLMEIGTTAEVHLEGAANLVGQDLELNPGRLREIFRTLEEKQRLLDLLERFLEQSRTSLAIQVGLGELHPSLADLSLILLTVTLPSGLSTRVAVLGPLRMNYSHAVASVFHVGETIQALSS